MDAYTEMHFPLAGIDLSRAFCDQQPKQVQQGLWSRSTPDGVNVRGWEQAAQRLRGGSRPGLSKYLPTRPGGTEYITQELATIVATGPTAVQTSLSGRVVYLVSVSQGNVYWARAGDTAWTAATNMTTSNPPLNSNGVMFSAPNVQKLWYADGVNWVYFDASDQTVRHWVATAGTLPVDSRGNKPRLICTWRGRTVLSGLLLDGQNWFMSAVGDPTNFNYSDVNAPPTLAVAGSLGPQGVVGDVITGLIPYSDDELIFGGDSSIHMMAGDPAAGGAIDRISDSIGMAWGAAWAKDPYGTLYFVSNKTGIYSLVPGQQPVRISQQIEQLLLPINTGEYIIRLGWDDRFQGLWVFVTLLANPADTTHFFWEARTGAWWKQKFANLLHNPVCLTVFDGNRPDDRALLIGSWDGYVRKIDPDAVTDDGTAIDSSVVIGPLTTKNFDEIRLDELLADLASDSGDVDWSCFVGTTPEIALSSTALAWGTWSAGRNNASPARCAGHGIYVKLDSSVRWALERIRGRVTTTGGVRSRVK